MTSQFVELAKAFNQAKVAVNAMQPDMALMVKAVSDFEAQGLEGARLDTALEKFEQSAEFQKLRATGRREVKLDGF